MALKRDLQIVYTDPSQNVKEFNISNVNPQMNKATIQTCVSAITALWNNTLVGTYIVQKIDINELD